MSRYARRGSYAILSAVSLSIILGFGALAVDTSMIRLTELHLQDVADAAAHTALFVLKRTGDTGEATRAAQAVVAKNQMFGKPGTLANIEYGVWDDGAFQTEPTFPNAVRTEVSREGADGLDLTLARVLGFHHVNLRSEAIAATRSLQIVLVMDITGSWDWPDFLYAREAALLVYENLRNAHGPEDMIGMTTFHNVYGYEWTPMTYIEDTLDGSLVAQWSAMGVSSRSGYRDNNYSDPSWRHPCRYNERFASAKKNDYNHPAANGKGGCFPGMPRWYTDENGTDHTVGIEMARTMFDELDDIGAYRAMIILTDGEAADTRNEAGLVRGTQGYTETRFREYKGAKRSVRSIEDRTIQLSRDMHEDLNVHTWMVSFVSNNAWMRSVPQGDGYYMLAQDPQDIVEIFNEISQSLPNALVR